MKKFLAIIFSLSCIAIFSVPAQATIILPEINLDFSSLGGGVFNDIEEITYTGIAHAQLFDTNGNGTPNTLETFITDGQLAATGYVDTGGITQVFTVGNYITFAFSVDGVFINDLGFFRHITATGTTGALDIYWDSVNNASKTTGAGYQDGTKIASFDVLAGDGGQFDVSNFDGNDDATFLMNFSLPGVILDEFGNDLPVGLALAITDSNFDADPTNVGSFSIPTPSSWPAVIAGSPTAGRTAPGSAVNFYASEYGSARFGIVPEPGTLFLLGFGLLGAAAVGRKKYM